MILLSSRRSAAASSSVRSSVMSATAALAFPAILSPRVRDRLPLQVRNRVGAAARQRHNVIFDVAGAWAGQATRRRARMLPLKFVLNLQRPRFARPGCADGE